MNPKESFFIEGLFLTFFGLFIISKEIYFNSGITGETIFGTIFILIGSQYILEGVKMDKKNNIKRGIIFIILGIIIIVAALAIFAANFETNITFDNMIWWRIFMAGSGVFGTCSIIYGIYTIIKGVREKKSK